MPITYTDKVSLVSNPNPDINKVTAADMNEIKSVVNTNETALASKVPTSRILTIDGVALDLSADRSWTTGTGGSPNFYNVVDNGLVRDGVTDNSAALAALVAAADTGAWLYFPAGSYLFLSTVTVTKKLHLVGDGVNNTILLTSVNNVTVIDYDYTGNAEVSDVIIKDLTISCTAVSTPVSPSIGLRVQNSSSRLRFINVYVGGFYNNVVLTNPVEYSFEYFYCIGWVNAGLDMRSSGAYVDAGDGCIDKSWFIPATYNSVYSIYQENGGGLKISNTKFNYQASPLFQSQHHYYYEGTGGTVDLNISNSSFENASVNYIRVGVSGAGVFREVCITGCDIGDTPSNGVDGIVLSGIDYVSITGNTFKSAGSGTRDAITLTNCTNVTLFNTYQGWSNNVVQSGSTVTTPVLIDPAVSPADDDFLQRKSGVWTNRTIAQVQADLGISSSSYVTVTGTDTLDSGDYNKTILCSGTSSDYTITLPTAVGITGVWFDFVGVTGLTKVVTVNANSTETINGLTVDRPFTGRGGFKIVSDGSNWQVVDEKPSWIVYVPSSFTGFSTTPANTIKYSLLGKQMSIAYDVASTGPSGTAVNFAIPTGYTIANNSYQYARVMNNGAFLSTGMSETPTSGTVLNFYTTGAGGAFSGVGNRALNGLCVFEIQ